jgi:predicted enzyme related to lactoylglutathione lyase
MSQQTPLGATKEESEMPNPVVHFEVIGKDAKKLQDFYAQLFGWKVDANNPMNYGIVEAQGGQGIGGGIGPSQAANSYVTFYVQVDNPQAFLDKAVQLGGKVAMPPMEIPGEHMTVAQFTDVEGNLIGIMKSEH